MIGRRKYWHTPPLDILGGGNASAASTITSPYYIAHLLAQIGLPCTPAGHTIGSTITSDSPGSATLVSFGTPTKFTEQI